ncbi:uncharacterized protein LOC143277607 [Babylonia areolata]|uniref:uncharacterized protein LOC143277607 n=1 Tax=Babylonia areolata TaxID=304850 RepID=UPI003FD28025
MMDTVAGWTVRLLVSVTVVTVARAAGGGGTEALCPDLLPPYNGVLKCQTLNNSLQCTATCLEGHVLEGGHKVIHRTCLEGAHSWLQGSPRLPRCVQLCNRSLTEATADVTLTVSSSMTSADHTGHHPSPLQALSSGTWSPAVDNILQYVQVDLGSPHTVRAWSLRGDGTGSYVRLFRLLFSVDGLHWTPYSDGRVMDKFLTGNFDSSTEVTEELSNPQMARYVRLNPLSWHRHIAVQWDLFGCPYHVLKSHCDAAQKIRSSDSFRCRLPQPPHSGAVNCERNATHVVCTAYCLDNRVFPDLGPALDLTCDPDVGVFTHTPLPACVERNTTVPPLNISGPCMREEGDCSQTSNGDYQYCGDCHYFSTCSQGYFFLRPCPEQLQFDSHQGLCDYHSATCDSKRLTHFKATRAARRLFSLPPL